MRWFDTETRSAKILQMMERKLIFKSDQLSRKLGVSEKTVANEIAQLNRQLSGTALIDLTRGEYRLYLFDIPSCVKIRDEITKPIRDFENPQIRISYIADVLMNTADPSRIDDMAEEMDVSRSTLNGDLKRLKSILSEYGIEVIGKPNTGLSLKGDEYEIRRFILENNYELIYNRDVLDKDIWNRFEALTQQYGLESNTVRLFGRYLTVCLDRYLNGYPVHFPHPRFFELKQSGLYKPADELADAVSESLGITLPPEERIFLTIPLAGMRNPVEWGEIGNLVDIGEETAELVQKIIDVIRSETDLSFQFTDELDEFICHIYFLTNRLRYGLRLENPIKDEMRAKFPLAWNMASRAGRIVEESVGCPVSEDEIGFLASYFEVFIEEQRHQNQRKFRVLVVHHSGGAAQRLIAYQLRHIFEEDTVLDIIPDRPGCLDDVHQYDLLITTDRRCSVEGVPVIYLDEVFDEKILRQRIDQVRYINQLDIPVTHGSNSVLLSLLDDSRIFVFEPETAYDDILTRMGGALSGQGLADKGFTERLLEREHRSSMRFSEQVSFPHTFHLLGRSPGAALGIIPRGLAESGNEELRIVILAALPKEAEDDVTLVRLYEEIVRLSENQDVIRSLSGMRCYSEILHYFIADKPIFDR